MPTFNLWGYRISSAGLQGDVGAAWGLIRSGRPGGVMACANPHSLIVARDDVAFREALQRADILTPDGVGIVIAARLLGAHLPERVAGFEFFDGLTRMAQDYGGLRYFFLGSSDAVLAKITERIAREHPGVTVCGALSPPFKAEFSAEENRQMIERINAARPDVLWVGMTAPKQEKWIEQHRAELNVPLSCAVGAVFDFYAGTRKRASDWVCRLGLEWLPRLLREPRRLFRRNFVSSPMFMGMVLAEKLRRMTGRGA